jgi:hypothetical protein
MKKGIVAAPARVSGNGSQFRSEQGLTAEELRYFLLYWDKVVIPTTNLIHLAVPQEDALLSTGVVTRPRVPFSGTFNGELMAKAQLLAQTTVARDLIKNDRSTDWALHQIGSELIIPDTESIEKQLVRVDLISTLPVPSGDVPFTDILEFKERRKDELIQLHQAIDDLYLEILSSPDASLKSKQAVSKFRQSIESLNSVTGEKWKSTGKFDLSAELNISGKEIAAGVAAGAVFDFYTNLCTFPVGAVVGAVASLIKVRASSTKSFEPSKEKQVLGYLASAHKENILPNEPEP